MITIASVKDELDQQFPTDPVPPYPPMMGMDPLGVDEYAPFANVRWNEVPAASHGGWYDICPPNGFSSFDSLHMWNYHLPGFLSFSLADDERSIDALDSFMYFFNRCDPKMALSHAPSEPWWKSGTFSGGYSREQCQVVVKFLHLLKPSEGNPPLYHEWDDLDAETLGKWIHRLEC